MKEGGSAEVRQPRPVHSGARAASQSTLAGVLVVPRLCPPPPAGILEGLLSLPYISIFASAFSASKAASNVRKAASTVWLSAT